MHKPVKNKKNIVLISFVIPVFISAFFIFFNKKFEISDYKTGVFAEVNPAYADTTLKYALDDVKIGQIIICNFGKLNNENSDSLTKLLYKIMPGGIIYQTDSVSSFAKTQNRIFKYSEINPFVFSSKNFEIPEYNDVENLLSPEYFENIDNDSLKIKYSEKLSEIYQKSGISSIFVTGKNNCKSIGNNLKTKSFFKLLTFVDADKFLKTDSANVKENKSLIKSGLKGIYCDENINSSEILKINNFYDFDGIYIKVLKSSELNPDSVATFFKSGADMFITDKPELLKNIITELIENELIDNVELRTSIRKILLAKTFAGINDNIKISYDELKKLYEDKNLIALKNKLIKKSLVLLKNRNRILPFKNVKNPDYKILILGNNNLKIFTNTFLSYAYAGNKFVNISKPGAISEIKKIKKTGNFITVLNIVKLNDTLINAIRKNEKAKNLVLINFGKPENILYADSFDVFLNINNNSELEQKYAAYALFGGINIQGKCPCKLRNFALCDSVKKIKKVRVSECLPEEVGLNSGILSKIDSIAKGGIMRGAFPGCQVVVFKNGYNVYDKAFGYHTYAKRQKVRKTDLYDLASVTKIASTTTATMKLYDQGRLRLNDKLGKFFRDKKIDYSNIKPDTIINIDTLKYTEVKDFDKILKNQDTLRINDSMLIAYDTLIVTATPKNNIFRVRIIDLLMHKSGISPVLPILPYVIFKKNFYDSLEINKKRFYEKIQNDTSIKDKNIEFNPKREVQKIYDTYFSKKYIRDSAEIKIAENFYFKNNWFDTLWRDTKRLRVYSRKIYQYSDINMILLQSAIDSLNHRSMNSYMRRTFYLPMGLKTMCYKPRKYFSLSRIVPTEDDKYWREQLLRGNVHDPSAAMLGGISGNAGLFSDAYDLAVLGQMWLNGGTYGGIRYISNSTVKKFTGFQENTFRGLGFDKQHKKAIIAKDAPPESFGHTGFTGTCIWVDPINEIVFVFLSNRVNPSAKNWKINRLKVRQKIHQTVYDAMK